MTKADDERELAGYVAPIVRGTSETLLRRRVKTYDRDTGEVTGEVTMRQVIGGLAEVTKLEIEVIDGKRPKHFTCDECGKVFEMPKAGVLRTTCKPCLGGTQAVCPCGCGKAPPKYAFSPSTVAKRGGAPWRCRNARTARGVCAGGCGKMVPPYANAPSRAAARGGLPWSCAECKMRASGHEALTPSQREARREIVANTVCSGGCGRRLTRASAMSARAVARRGGKPWACKQCAVKRDIATTPSEKRSALRHALVASMSEEQRRAMTLAARSITPEERREARRRATLSRTAEQRSESAKRGAAKWTAETRARAAAKRAAAWTPDARNRQAEKAKAAAARRRGEPVLPSPDGGAQKTGAND